MSFFVPFGTASSYRHSKDLPAQPASPPSAGHLTYWVTSRMGAPDEGPFTKTDVGGR